ncbi:N-acetylmuramoyl-L-alanine amidase [Bacillus sp. J14TS2]|uniref:N-acetylmuramoyl-L-alanine amidase n=1 Tax=Bacillus sp. J14TS2 TaxID=2807188 RepID=UPI001B030177|nr:N-acetylmuramoyl-L-alanine amidase [Bacillus sp. J14TS2]GIN74044.1 N-acetylmuramoyl-L-alanine amidase [Bacillus sp. J14TS2]
MVKVALDAGHGGFGVTPGKRTPAGEYEWNFNDKVVVAAIKYLKQYKDVEVLRLDDPTGKTDVPLTTRTNKANQWGADILISDHHNANTGKWGSWTGTEVYTYDKNLPSAEKLASIVLKHILKAYGLANRGHRRANFHMLRESKMDAILIEGGFMDSTIDIKKLRDDKVLDAAGKAIAEGVAEYFGLKKDTSASKPKPDTKPTGNTYKVLKAIGGYSTATDAKAKKNKKTTVKAGTYQVFNKSGGMINVTTKAGVPGSWINPQENKATSKPKPSGKTFLIKVKADTLWYYDKPDWNAKKATVKKGEVFTVVDTLTVNGSKMYKLKSGTYMTANPSYVQKV